MNKMKIIDKVLKRCYTDENYELDDVIEELEKFKLAQQQINLTIPIVSKQRELLIAFKTWEVDNDIKNLLPEQLADFYLDESN